MNQHKFAFTFAWIAALMVATPAVGQLHNFPVQSLPQGPAAGNLFVATQFARGLNDNSFKQNSFAAAVGRSMERVTVAGAAGYVASDTDALTLAASVAVHMLRDESIPVQVSLQGGLGWTSLDIPATTESSTILSFPIGVAISGRPSDGPVSVRPWVMPRLNMVRASALGASATQTDIGASAGVSFTSESGVGGNLAADWINVEGGSPFGISVGVHYVVGS